MGIFSDIFKRSVPEPVKPVVENRNAGAVYSIPGLNNEGFIANLSAVYAAVELISNSLAELPIVVKVDGKVDDTHAFNHLFCNNAMSKYMIIKQLVWDILVYDGNGYLYIRRDSRNNPKEFVYLSPKTVSINYNEITGELKYLGSGLVQGIIDPKDIIHLYKNSRDGIRGVPITDYGKKVFDLAKYTDKTASNYYKGGCNLTGVLTLASPATDAQIEQMRYKWSNLHGVNGDSDLAILNAGMTYSQVGVNATETQMLEARTYNISEIARYFNISPVLLGDLSKSGYSTIEAANIEFVQRTLLPFIVMFETEINRKISHRSNIRIDFDETFLIKSDKTAQASYLNTLVTSGIISVNEARAQLGLNPVDGGDNLIVPYSKIEDNIITQTEENTINQQD